ncbi:hypothetical protein M422DRAFT_196319 [Sphaerobolus stellatus SS14]|uniref:Unplaced genomic scaffold SPHSTscaffold_741, whole genome shotgun sequence n=1 Tax=Sphaerobolus stellatus (strain SS14) TaxID=990650 RepID=A0A0C9U200_SPHS4|nr:hypothetical protein M422DRAFT_196367 [Sphaerobolus stellatus SS14]KIJ23130.1 hypothetical protein M422DRAFT_196319 [Sphaerobolus stellatus SS14]
MHDHDHDHERVPQLQPIVDLAYSTPHTHTPVDSLLHIQSTAPLFHPPSPIPSPSPSPSPAILEVPYRSTPTPLSPQPHLQTQLETPPHTPPSTSLVLPTFEPSTSTSTPTPLTHSTPSTSTLSRPYPSDLDPDPLLDITRLRVRSHPKDCLYPGAVFCGNQKSGRSSYEVSVTIVDVDFRSSFLCGYLCIRGLTEDWPELTTYFDAQIIGPRYGFVTDGWGATEEQDMMHWSKFESFERVKGDVRGPKMALRNDAERGEGVDRGCVFMRWKERFLVPDHRVRDINGASFAGFYYVCVDFNPRANGHSCKESDLNSDMDCTEDEQCDTATMSGFYFHQSSEPYQQLSLRHVPRESSGVFEFR